MTFYKIFFPVFIFLFFSSLSFFNEPSPIEKENIWVEERWSKMSEEERLGQLFMVAVYPKNGSADEQRVKDLIEKQYVGGLIMFQGGPTQEAFLINKYQSLAKTPLLVSVDGEWGLNMRMDSVRAFPRQLLFGAIQDNAIVYNFGKEVARQCRRVGININFAPVVDVNNNMSNPVIGDRSFGENKENVTAKAFQYMRGMQDHEVLACAKHFPGHGDTDVDSHYDLPILYHSPERLDSLELYPFRNLAQHGIGSIMVAHLNLPLLDSSSNLPSSLSKKLIDQILKEKIGFEGLVFTDAMNMKGMTKNFKPGEADLKAIQAGVDMLLMPDDVPLAKKMIKEAIEKGEIDPKIIEEKVKKILRVKYKLGLFDYKPVSTENVISDLNNDASKALYEEIVEKAITLLDNPNNLIPLQHTTKYKMASLSLGASVKTNFQNELELYGVREHHQNSSIIEDKDHKKLLDSLSKKDIVIIGLHKVGRSAANNFDITPSTRLLIEELNKKTKVILVLFGSPYGLKFFESIPYSICSYINDKTAELKTARALFGVSGFQGKLPVSASKKYSYGKGLTSQPKGLEYCQDATELGFNSNILNKIDSIALEAIEQGATPGCQVMAVKNGTVVLHKTYGQVKYKHGRAINKDDVYDLASITKVAATTIAIMKLVDEGKVELDKKLSDYIVELKGSNKESISIREVLLHEAGLKAWIPFYLKTLDENKKPDKKHYRVKADEEYCFRVAEGVFICKSKQDSLLWKNLIDSDKEDTKQYKYSDLGFILLGKLIENVSGKSLENYVKEAFYNPLGLKNMTFKPLQNGIAKNRIIPTEIDNFFRHQELHGDVHDQNAAILGGNAGHAGLFSDARDLAVIFQMLLNKGTYQNKRYIREETVNKFIAQFSEKSRRGLGFDRKEISEKQESVNVAWQASKNTFGHLGFTGVSVWADPDNQLIYIFLSNRTYPNAENNKLLHLNIRTRIQEIIYQAMER
jgi:beta-glucosidase-like glycosyl hydrolase/CubicO group peptidase (beta-lactamase class C family)